MGLFSFFSARTSKKALSATPAVLETMAARQFSPYVALGGTNINAQRVGNAYVKVQNGSYSWLYLYSPPVRRVVDYIARNISQLGLKCYERVSDDEREHRGDHAAAEALRHPNPQTPGNYFIQEFVKCHLVFGNAYALKFRPNPSAPLMLVLLNPARVGIVGQSHFQADAYRIWAADGSFFDVPPEDMLRWPAPTGDDPRCGESPLETLRESLAADVAAQAAVTELHRNGGALPGWIERPAEIEWTEEARKRFQESWANQAKDGKRHTPVLEEGMVYKQGGVTPEDAQFIESRKFTLDYVASLYGMKDVPPESEEARRQFYADVLPPLCELMCSFLDLHILQQEYAQDDYYFECNLDEKLITDDRIKTLISAAGAPIYTRNESRAVLNKPPLPGGDELITPGNVVVGDNPLPSQGVMPVQDPNKPPQDGSHRSGEADEPAAAGRRSLNGDHRTEGPKAIGGSMKLDGPFNGNGNGHVKDVPLVPRRARSYHRRDNWVPQYGEKFSSHFARQRQAIKSKKTKANVADERWNEELSADLLEVSRRHLRAEGKQAAFRMASEFDPGQGEHWLDAKAIGAATAVNQTTAEHIEEKGVEDAFALAIEVRAAAAGAGYATDVHGFSWKAAAQQHEGAGATVTIDGGECDICAEFQGTWPIDEVPGWPGYHNSCNCVVDITPGSKSLAVRETKDDQTELIQVLLKALANGDKSLEFAEALAKAISNLPAPQVNVAPAETHIHEGAVNSHATFEAPSPAEVTIAEGAVQVDGPTVNVEAAQPAEVTIQKGAVQNHVKVDAPPPAEVNVAPAEVNVAPAEVRFGKNAINVEAPPPANVNIEEGAIKVDAPVNVDAPPPAEVNVTTPDVQVDVNLPKEGKKTVTFSDGTKAEIEESEED